jgi:RimJ/RimL family protein N-acetyltransferase
LHLPDEEPPVADPLLFPVPSTFETPRLLLRSFRVDDAQALAEALADSLVDLRRFLWFLPWVAEEPGLQSAEVRCRSAEANFLLRTDLPYLAFERQTGKLIGSVGLHRTDWQLPKTEVGYWIRTGSSGRGYATEGVVALTSWALEQLGAQRVELVTDEANLASRRVAERSGFALEGICRNVQRAPDGTLRSNCIYAKLPTAA